MDEQMQVTVTWMVVEQVITILIVLSFIAQLAIAAFFSYTLYYLINDSAVFSVDTRVTAI
jgi:hypothetical protein